MAKEGTFINKIIKNVLKKIEEAGYEAYVVGGYPRNLYLGRELFDIDICTSAKPAELKTIFPRAKMPKAKYGSVILKHRNLNFEITTFRREKKYSQNRKPCVFEYITDIKEDLLRRDFTINTLCIDKNGQIIDFLGIKEDLDNKIIKTIKDPAVVLKQDALRILRAVRFATVLEFDLDDNLKEEMQKKAYLLENISMERKREELDKIFISKNVKAGIKLLTSLKIADSLLLLNIENIVIVNNYKGIWAQLDVDNIYPFNRREKKIIKGIKKMLKENDFSDYALYNNGLYVASIAGEIKKHKAEEIIKRYNQLPIKEKSDINISSQELLAFCQDKREISRLYKEIEQKIITGVLKNEKESILNYLKSKK